MTENVEKHASILCALRRASPALRRQMLSGFGPAEVEVIGEMCMNLLEGNVPLTFRQKKKLKVHKWIIRKYNEKPRNWRWKKNLLIQEGGHFLPQIIEVIGTALPCLLN